MVYGGSSKNMELKKDKRGIFFTIIVIVLLIFFVISFTFFSGIVDRKPINNRVSTLNSFVSSVDDNLPRQLHISAFRIIFLLEKQVVDTGDYIPDLNSSFNELFFNGTLNGNSSQEMQSIMQGATFSDIVNSVNNDAGKVNAQSNIILHSVELTQEDPWNVKITIDADVEIKDLGGLASWNKTEKISALVPINGFLDPLYLVNTGGVISNKIVKAQNFPYVSGGDISNLSAYASNSTYVASTSAPDFLDRLQGINEPSAYGIESIVNIPYLSAQGIQAKSKSVVDYIYFSSDNPSFFGVNGMPYWFKLDDSHLNFYGVGHLKN